MGIESRNAWPKERVPFANKDIVSLPSPVLLEPLSPKGRAFLALVLLCPALFLISFKTLALPHVTKS